MLDFLNGIDPAMLGLLAGIFTWSMTALGASMIFLFKNLSKKALNYMMGYAAGVMIAASFFSLIIPGLEYAEIYNPNFSPIVIIVAGFMTGGLFVFLLDKIIPHTHYFQDKSEGPTNNQLSKSKKLLLAMTIHNIPEGMAVGVAFGAYAISGDPILLSGAVALAIGIGLQNFPEGAAVSFPMVREGYSKKRAFFFGQASALVEPIAAFFGVILIGLVSVILPFSLAFAAGAMIFVVAEDLIPEAQSDNQNNDLVGIFLMLGLATMMTLDIVLG